MIQQTFKIAFECGVVFQTLTQAFKYVNYLCEFSSEGLWNLPAKPKSCRRCGQVCVLRALWHRHLVHLCLLLLSVLSQLYPSCLFLWYLLFFPRLSSINRIYSSISLPHTHLEENNYQWGSAERRGIHSALLCSALGGLLFLLTGSKCTNCSAISSGDNSKVISFWNTSAWVFKHLINHGLAEEWNCNSFGTHRILS